MAATGQALPKSGRTASSAPSSSSSSSSSSQGSSGSFTKGFKKEYCRLKTLVPALSDREDLSKVEIIEETIRYIDALHHQLAIRMDQHQQQREERGDDGQAGGGDAGQQEQSVTHVTQCSPPLRDTSGLDANTSSAPHSSEGAVATSDAVTSPPPPPPPSQLLSSSSSSASMSSPRDLKAAVENIQAMFNAYLLQQQP